MFIVKGLGIGYVREERDKDAQSNMRCETYSQATARGVRHGVSAKTRRIQDIIKERKNPRRAHMYRN